MSSYISIIVGHRCSSDSIIATYAPYCVRVFPVGEFNEESIVGTLVEKKLTCEAINLTDFDKEKYMLSFDEFKKNAKESTHPEEFSSKKKYNEWFDQFENSTFDIFVIVSDY